MPRWAFGERSARETSTNARVDPKTRALAHSFRVNTLNAGSLQEQPYYELVLVFRVVDLDLRKPMFVEAAAAVHDELRPQP